MNNFFSDIENPLLRAFNRLTFLKNLQEINENAEQYLEMISANARAEMQMVIEFIYSHGWDYTRKVVQNEVLENSKVIDGEEV